VLAIVGLSVLGVVGMAMLFKTIQLRGGGSVVARMLGGRLVSHSTQDQLERRLLNVVEEMAIASGSPVPDVFVLEKETGLNAFAAGWGQQDAAIAVTRGLLEKLDRDELQGVIAHEFSHVFHGDMRLNIRLMGVLFGIVCIATVGEILLHSMGRGRRSGGKNNGAHLALFGLALVIIGWIGVFFAGLIKAAVSRQREYLADASAVAYTRNPLGIGMALVHIGGLGSGVKNAHAREASHLFFANGIKSRIGSLGATHPPINQRVERVLPGFLEELLTSASPVEAARNIAPPPGASGFAGAAQQAAVTGPPIRPATGIAAASVAGLVGHIDNDHVQHAREMIAELPLDVLAAAHDPVRVQALLYALLIDGHPGTASAQEAILDHCEETVGQEARTLATAVRELPPTSRLPLLEMMVPALRRLPEPATTALQQQTEALARADDVISPFEFALLKTVRRHTRRNGARPRKRRRRASLAALAPDAELVLSVLAHENGEQAEAAFAQGAKALTGTAGLRLRPRSECRLEQLDDALDRLAELSPLGKRILLTACANAAGADGIVQPAEGELLRAFAEHWECPMPPVWSHEGKKS